MGTGSNLDQKEKDVCRTIIMETTCNQQQTILSFYKNILNTVFNYSVLIWLIWLL